MMMSTKTVVVAALLIGLLPVGQVGCSPKDSTQGEQSHDSHDGHDHGPNDNHDHGDHDGHDHGPNDDHDHDNHDGHDHGNDEHGGQGANADNWVAVPEDVRSNLGISFVKVERRDVERTLRIPGKFEYLPSATREFRSALPGRVEILVNQFDRVEPGDLLFRIDAPQWRAIQLELGEAESLIQRMDARMGTFEPLLEAHRQHEQSLTEIVAIWTQRIEQLRTLRDAGGGRTEELAQASAALATTRVELSQVQEKNAELAAQRLETQAELVSAHSRLDYLLDSASVVTSIDRSKLERVINTDYGKKPLWATIETLEVRATQGGVVEQLGITNGSWADERAAVLTIVQPEMLRFHGSGLQSDLGVLRDGLTARIVPPTPTASGRSVSLQDTMRGQLTIGLVGDPLSRTLELYLVPDSLSSWARPGVTAYLEVVTDHAQTALPLAIPMASVHYEGLQPIIFRRTINNPDIVMKTNAKLGVNDGRWVELIAGAEDGDEIVLDGAFQLMLSTNETIQRGGHFHSDGTFHEEGD